MIINKRKKFLKKELKRINRIIEITPWKYEIVKKGKELIREGIRTDYDRFKERIDAYNVRIGDEKKKSKMDMNIIQDMTKLAAKTEAEVKQLEEQMKELDQEIEETDSTCQGRVEAARSYKMIIEKLLKI